MSARSDSLILEHLRAVRGDMAVIREDTRETRTRVTSLEGTLAGIKRDVADLYGEVAALHLSFDRLAARFEQVEKRLDLIG